ncbi:MAG: hypothetical protein QOH90_1922, partial [Actinomycetota bacterium]|nr:hypothetical protein [Actinomycetota bacterium]
GHQSVSSAAPCAERTALDPVPRLASDLPLPREATVFKVARRKGYVKVGASKTATMNSVYSEMQHIMQVDGFTILNAENEQTDAEIFFARYADVAGVARLKPGRCSGDVTIAIIYDPLEERNKAPGSGSG